MERYSLQYLEFLKENQEYNIYIFFTLADTFFIGYYAIYINMTFYAASCFWVSSVLAGLNTVM
jgi:hypothetical protein